MAPNDVTSEAKSYESDMDLMTPPKTKFHICDTVHCMLCRSWDSAKRIIQIFGLSSIVLLNNRHIFNSTMLDYYILAFPYAH
jgi:hypothetical protein